MKKALSSLLALSLLLLPGVGRTQSNAPIMVGFVAIGVSNGTATLALSASGTWLQLAFVPARSVTLNKAIAYASAVNGTLGASDLRMEILRDINNAGSAAVTVQDAGDTVTLTAHPFSNGEIVRFNATANGITADTDYWVCNKAANTFQIDATSSACAAIVPITSDGSNNVRGILQASATVTATPTGAAWVEWTGFTLALTAGTQYRALIRNMNGVPGTNYPTWRFGSGGVWSFSAFGWTKVHTTDSGATWVSPLTQSSFLRLEYSDATYEGIPIQLIGADGNTVYSNREVGSSFVTPANAAMNAAGACIWQAAESGTPTGNARIRLYNNVTLLATGVSTWSPAAVAAGWYCTAFSATQAVSGGSTLRVVLSETTQSDASANAYRAYAFTIHNDANSKALMPFNGTIKETYTTDATASPVVFTDTDTAFVPVALLLDVAGEFAATAGGGTGRVIAQ